jgi:hypothetical protein
MTVPVFCSNGVPEVGVRSPPRLALGDLVGVDGLLSDDDTPTVLSGRDEILDNPKTNKNPNSPTYQNSMHGLLIKKKRRLVKETTNK